MASYFIVENNKQSGPYSIDQLSSMGITSDTMVWTDGMTNWRTAGEVPELQSVLNQQDYQEDYNQGYDYGYGYQSNYVPMPDSHKSKAVWSLVLTCISMFCCGNCFGIISLVFSILGLVAASRVSSDYMAGNYQGALNSSVEANKWSNWSITLLIIGALLCVIGWVLYYFLVLAATMAGSY